MNANTFYGSLVAIIDKETEGRIFERKLIVSISSINNSLLHIFNASITKSAYEFIYGLFVFQNLSISNVESSFAKKYPNSFLDCSVNQLQKMQKMISSRFSQTNQRILRLQQTHFQMRSAKTEKAIVRDLSKTNCDKQVKKGHEYIKFIQFVTCLLALKICSLHQ